MFFYKCHFDFDTNRVVATLADGSVLTIDCIAVENELAETWLDRRELDFLIYNEPESYVELILTGRMEEYLNTVREGQTF
mgnify:CR=1 FL=1